MAKWIKNHDGDIIDIEKFVMIRDVKDDGIHRIIGYSPGIAVDSEDDERYDETEMFTVKNDYEAKAIMAAIEGMLKPYVF